MLPMWFYTKFYWPLQAHIIYFTAFFFTVWKRDGESDGLQVTGWKRDRGESSEFKEGGRFFRWHCAGTARKDGAKRAPQEAVSIKMTYSTDEARIMPAVAQGLQKPIPGINLKVTAMAFGAKHLLIIWREKGDGRRDGECIDLDLCEIIIRIKQ